MKPANLNISRRATGAPTALRHDWYSEILDEKLDINSSGIYEWRIADLGLYIGQAKKLVERIGAYPRNVRGMLEGKSWHGVLTNGDPLKTYRPIHRALFQAYKLESPRIGCCFGELRPKPSVRARAVVDS